jgi:glycosyltransferase involved in cell wall biosynthesis
MVLPRLWRGRSVVTVHDVAFLDDPALLTGASRRYYDGVAASVARADRVITVSEHTRARLLAHTRVDPARIRVIHNAIPEHFRSGGNPAEDRAALASLGLGATSFILFVGTIEPRKNLITLLDAADRLAAQGQATSLVLAGGDGWLSAPVYDRARAMGPGADVRFLGFVPDALLPALYRRAAVVAHPAVDEGFGMTVAEAMAAGTPVVAARAGSLPEVCGDAAVLVDPGDVAGWAEGLRRVLADTDLAAELSARGRRQSAGFTEEAMAAATLEVYREVLV